MKLNIALLAGDGIGPEVIDQAVKVSDAVASKFGHEITWKPALTGAAAIDAVGEPYPDETHEICTSSDAVLFGAIGHPKFDNDPSATVRPEQGLLKMRKKLGLFAKRTTYFYIPVFVGQITFEKRTYRRNQLGVFERIDRRDLLWRQRKKRRWRNCF